MKKSQTVRVSPTVVRRASPPVEIESTIVDDLREFRATQRSNVFDLRVGPPSKAARRTMGAVMEALGVPVERDGGRHHGWRAGTGSGNARNAG